MAETPEKLWKGVSKEKILDWDKLKNSRDPKGLEALKGKKWTAEEKLTFIPTGFKREDSFRGFFPAGISRGLLSSWVHKYQLMDIMVIKRMRNVDKHYLRAYYE